MSTYTPDRWMVVELASAEDGSVKKIFSGSYGGYLGSDTWKLSSQITETIETEDMFEFKCESGSTYRCFKHSYGASNYMSSIYYGWESQSKAGGITINIVEGYNK